MGYRYQEYEKQPILFKGVLGTATDIDCINFYCGTVFVIEAKIKNVKPPEYQKKMLKSIVMAYRNSGSAAYGMIVEHSEVDPQFCIDLVKAEVSEILFDEWERVERKPINDWIGILARKGGTP